MKVTLDTMKEELKKGKPLKLFHKGDIIQVSNRMVKKYSYTLDEEPGTNFQDDFKPYKTPGEILSLGAFEGKYLNDCISEFPKEWFIQAIEKGKLSPEANNVDINYFHIHSRQPLSAWRKAGWVPSTKRKTRRTRSINMTRTAILADPARNPDERGWFQWYCRYWLGRRIPELDTVQIQRWKNFKRHSEAVKKGCKANDLTCRPRQRQALLHWAWKYNI